MSSQNIQLVSNQYGDVYINVINDTHFKTLSAREIITAILISKLNKEATFYIIIGTDSGLFPKFLSTLPHQEKNKFLFIELDEILPVISDQISNIESDNIIITTFDAWLSAAINFGIEPYTYNDNVKLFASLAASEGHIENYTELFKDLEQSISSLSFEFNIRTYRSSFQREALLNLPDNMNAAEILRNTGSGFALVMGAGPTLYEHFDWIKSNRNNLTLFAVSRISKILLEQGIQPDVIVSVDPQDINYTQGIEAIKFENSILVHSSHVSNRLLSQFNGKKFYLGDRLFWTSEFNIKNFQAHGPTVSHTAIATAMQMGFTDILLAGVDFCFTKDGESHVSGTQTNKTSSFEVETYSGEVRKTIQDFLLSIRSLEALGKIFAGNIFNLSKQAARCEHVSYLSHPEIVYTSFDRPMLDSHTNLNILKDHLQKSEKELIKAEIKFKGLITLLQKALKLNNQWLNANDKQKIRLQLDIIEKKINSKKYKPYINACRMGSGRKFYSLLNQTREKKSDEHEHSWLEKYYNSQYESLLKIRDFLSNAKENLIIRKRELDKKM